MKKLHPSEVIGIFLYIAVILFQHTRGHGPLSDGMLVATLPLTGFAIILMTFKEGTILNTGLGLGLATSGILWQMVTLQSKPELSNEILLVTGLLVLIGVMLLAKSRGLPTGPASVAGWTGFGILWIATKVPIGTLILLLLSLLLVGLRLKLSISAQQSTPQKK